MAMPKDPIKAEEARKKISMARIGKPSPMKGRHHSDQARQKMSNAKKGKMPGNMDLIHSIVKATKGKKRSKEICKKISDGLKGKPNGKLGTHISESHRKALVESNKRRHGENSANWLGGISFEPYCPKFTFEFKERVRAYFGYVCPECGTPQNGKKLSVHHVNFNKNSCCDPNVPRLFIPLCHNEKGSCHNKTNFNREYWEKHFTDMIMGYYQGKCYFTKEEMEAYYGIK